jgi:hypothetical protein
MTAEELLQIIRFHKSNHKPQQELFQQLQNKTDRERCNALLGFIYKTDLSDTEILYFFDKYKSFSNYQNALIEVRRNERTANKVSTSTQSSLGSCLILCALGAVCLFMVWGTLDIIFVSRGRKI